MNRPGQRQLVALQIAAAVIALAFSSVPTASAPEGGFAPRGASRELKGASGIYEWTFDSTRGPSPFDRIALHRIARGPTPPKHPEIVVLYLPGTNMNGEVGVEDPRFSLPVYLATRGIDVWTLNYRTHFIPPDTPIEKLGELRNWTNDLFVGDINAAAKFVTAITDRRKLFVAGFSRGAAFAYMFAADNPDATAGLIILDGFISERPMPGYDSSKIADDLGGRQLTFAKRKKLLEMVIANPDGPAPIPQFKTARENLIHVIERPGALGGAKGLANPSGGFSDPVVLAKLLITYDRWWPAVQNSEKSSKYRAGAVGEAKIPVIAFASTNIYRDWSLLVAASAVDTGSRDVTRVVLQDWGHLDVIAGAKSEKQVFAPLVDWLRRHREVGQKLTPDWTDGVEPLRP
ncbi:MAG: alpha/beta hydrolase [Candidatus Binataceae bacterium]